MARAWQFPELQMVVQFWIFLGPCLPNLITPQTVFLAKRLKQVPKAKMPPTLTTPTISRRHWG
jgi:hypothetical protein